MADLERLRKELISLNAGAPNFEPTEPFVQESQIPCDAPTDQKAAGMPGDFDGHILRDLKTRGCPVCNHLVNVTWDFLAKRQYRLYANEQAQKRHAARRGFCPFHTWQLESVASPEGIGRGYSALMESLAGKMRALKDEGGDLAEKILRLTQNSTGCEVCRIVQQAEAGYLRQLAALLASDSARRALSRSQGVCLAHLGLLLHHVDSRETAEFLISEESRHFGELAEDLENYALKHAAARRGLETQDEEDACLRALIHLAGDRKLSGT